MKTLLIGFAFAGLWVSSATAGSKSYNVSIPPKFSIGGVLVKPGEYQMKIEGSVAVFSDDQSKQIAHAPVTVSTVAKKFEQTEILSSKVRGDLNKIEAIELQGTKLKVEFKQ